MATLLKRVRIIDPSIALDIFEDLYIDEERIEIAPTHVSGSPLIMNGKGLVAAPGLIDLHVHFREPGFVHKEDIASGIKASWAGGVTSAMVMPNTNPAIDEMKWVYYQKKRAKSFGFDLMVAAAATKGLLGIELSDSASLKKAGADALSDDGKVIGEQHMEMLLKNCRRYDLLCMQHAEDVGISCGAPFHEGEASRRFHIKGQKSSAEASVVARDIVLAEAIGARYHILHVSSAATVALIRKAKRRKALISSEVSPHHLLLSDRDIRQKDAQRKMNPPLRSKDDQEALLYGINDGTIDAVASDHAPHAPREKALDIMHAPFGVAGAQTSIVALLTLVQHKKISLMKAISLMTIGPARILKQEQRIGTLSSSLKNICVLDPNFTRVLSPRNLLGRSKNSAFIGMEMFGRVRATFQNGRLVYRS